MAPPGITNTLTTNISQSSKRNSIKKNNPQKRPLSLRSSSLPRKQTLSQKSLNHTLIPPCKELTEKNKSLISAGKVASPVLQLLSENRKLKMTLRILKEIEDRMKGLKRKREIGGERRKVEEVGGRELRGGYDKVAVTC